MRTFFDLSLEVVKKSFEMKQLLVFLVLCITSTICVELENVCSSGHFEYNGVLVNAFYRHRQELTFPSLSHLLINDSIACNRSRFIIEANFFEAMKIKNNYNPHITKLYTNDLNDATAEELGDKRHSLAKYWSPLYEMSRVEQWARCVDTLHEIINSAYRLLDYLFGTAKYNFTPGSDRGDVKPTTFEATEILEKLLEKFNSTGDGQTFALKGQPAEKVYSDFELALRGEFKFLTNGTIQPDTESRFTFDILLPFNSKQHTDEGCVPVEKLTFFYNKGRLD